MLTKILVPLDGSALAEGVLPFVESLAFDPHGLVTLLHVIDPSVMVETSRKDDRVAVAGSRLAQQRAQEYLSRVRQRISSNSKVVTSVTFGSAPETIVDFAQVGGYDMIAMSTHGRSGMGRWALGSVVDRVLHGTSLPLLVVRSPERLDENRHRLPLRRVLIPLDGSNFAAEAVPFAIELARRLSLEVQLVRVVEYQPGLGFGVPEEGLVSDLEDRAEAYLAGIQRTLQGEGLTVRGVLSWGYPAEPIVQAAHAEPRTIVVMSTHGRSGLGRWALGSTTDKVVRAVHAPVLIVRPATLRASEARAESGDSEDRGQGHDPRPATTASV